MKKIIFASILAALTSVAARADLIGTSVTGSLQFSIVPVNFFDASLGLVPAGYLNSPGTTTVHISNPATEFGFYDGANLDTVDFTGGILTIKDVSNFGSIDFHIKLTDAAFAGLHLTEVLDTFLNSGASASLVGNTISIDVPAFSTRGPSTFTAQYNLGAVSVPESGATFGMLAFGLTGLIALRARKASAV